MRVKFVVLALFMGCLVLLLGPTSGLTQGPGRGNRGGGLRGGGFDPSQWFDRMANGRASIPIAELRMGREEAQAWAQKQGITNGELNREQFTAYMQERMQSWGQGRPRTPGNGGATPPGTTTPGTTPPGSTPAPGPTPTPGAPQPGRGDRGGWGGDRGGWGGGGGGWGGGGWDWGDPNARADEMFRRLDKDGDGYLSYDEMSENLKAEKDKWDTNKDGQIDLSEWREYVRAYREQRQQEMGGSRWGSRGDDGMPPDMPPDRGNQKPEPRKRVTVYRAGKLPPNIPPWFKEYDTDNDSQIALYEWKDKNGTVEEFQKYDLNGDGFITVEELIRGGHLVARRDNGPQNQGDGAAPGTGSNTTPGAPGASGAGRPGRGGPGGGFDAGAIFDRIAQGNTIVIADQRWGRDEMQAWAQKQGITNGQLTRDQYIAYFQERMQNGGGRMMGGGGNRGGNRGGGMIPGGGRPGGMFQRPGGNTGGDNAGTPGTGRPSRRRGMGGGGQ